MDINPDIINEVMNSPDQSEGGGVLSSIDPSIIQSVLGTKGETGGASGATHGGPVSNVMWALGLLDRPRNALATGVSNLQDNDPNTGFWSGAYQGFMGDRETSTGDLLGIPRGQSSDAWVPWLAKEGAHLAANVVSDPLNLLFGAGAITKGLGLSKNGVSLIGRGAAAAGEGLHTLGMRTPIEAIAGSGLGKAVFNKSGNAAVESTINAVKREGSLIPVEEEARAFKKAIADSGIDQTQVFQAMERGTDKPEIQALADMGKTLMDKSRSLFEERNTLLEQLGQAPKAAIEEPGYNYMPRILSGRGRWELGKTFSSQDPQAFKQASREIYNWENPVTKEVVVTGKLGETPGLEATQFIEHYHPDKGIAPKVEQGFTYNGVRVEPKQATLAEVHNMFGVNPSLGPGAGKAMKPFIDNPADALYADIARKQKQVNFLKILKEGTDQGWLTKSTDPMDVLTGSLTKTVEGGLLSPVPLERALNIPGFEGLKAPLAVANRLENLHGIMASPTKAVGKVEELFNAFGRTAIGQMLNAYTSTWKRGVLGIHPGYMFANAVSNQFLMFLAGVRNPMRLIEGGEVLAGKGRQAVEGFTNAAANAELRLRDVIQQHAMGQMFGGNVGDTALGSAQMSVPFLSMMTDRMGVAGKPIQAVGDAARWLNDRGFQVSGAIENHARTTVALDWLKKNVKGVPTAKDWDMAAAHAKEFMFDYGDLTPLLRGVRQFAPFVSWTQAIIGRTLKDLGTQPQNLANIGRFVDAVFEPMSPDQKRLLDPNNRYAGPAMGLLGWRPTSPEGLPGQIQTSRFIPQGTIENLFGGFQQGIGKGISNLAGEVAGMAAPWLKTGIEGTTGINTFTGKPIDEIAGSGVGALTNPVTGGPYQAASQKLFGMNIPAAWQQAFNNLPPSRAVNMANALARGTLFEDKSQPEMSPAAKGMYFLTGGKVYPFDEVKLMMRRKREDSRAESAAKSKWKYAMTKGDKKGAQFYFDMWSKAQEERLKNAGLVEGGR